MRAVVKAEPRAGVEIRREHPEPTAGPGEVVIKVAATSICGTDLHLYEWDKSAQAFHPRLPLVMGHECSGTVEAIGTGVTLVKVGDRVAAESHIFCGRCYPCRSGDAHNCLNMRLLGLTWDGAFADYAKLPEQVLFPLPAEMPLDMGALFEGSGVALHALQRAGDVRGSTVVVSGCGPIGLVIVQCSLLFGAAAVIAIEPNAYRRKMAQDLGAMVLDPKSDDVVARIRNATARRSGADVAFEVSAAPNTMQTLFAALRREGTLVVIGHPSEPVSIDIAAEITKKGIVLKGIFGRRIWDTWELFASLLESKRLDLSWLVTHRLDLGEFERGMELLRGESAKVLIYPN